MSKHKYSRKSSRIDPVLSRGIISIVLIVAAILIVLSFFDKAGVIGVMLNDYVLSFLFGSIRYTTPVILIAFAWFIIRDMESGAQEIVDVEKVVGIIAKRLKDVAEKEA